MKYRVKWALKERGDVRYEDYADKGHAMGLAAELVDNPVVSAVLVEQVKETYRIHTVSGSETYESREAVLTAVRQLIDGGRYREIRVEVL